MSSFSAFSATLCAIVLECRREDGNDLAGIKLLVAGWTDRSLEPLPPELRNAVAARHETSLIRRSYVAAPLNPEFIGNVFDSGLVKFLLFHTFSS